jgi:hypothetical protein
VERRVERGGHESRRRRTGRSKEDWRLERGGQESIGQGGPESGIRRKGD